MEGFGRLGHERQVRGSRRGVRRSAGRYHRAAAREVRHEGRQGGSQRPHRRPTRRGGSSDPPEPGNDAHTGRGGGLRRSVGAPALRCPRSARHARALVRRHRRVGGHADTPRVGGAAPIRSRRTAKTPNARASSRACSSRITIFAAALPSTSTTRCRRTSGSARGRSSRSPWRARSPSCTASTSDARALARAVGRGKRSAIGTWTFEDGGLVVEGGRRADQRRVWSAHRPSADSLRPGDASSAIPEGAPGISGAGEAEAFARLPAPPERDVERVAHIVLMALLPALADADLAGFGRALSEVQEITGRWFASVQGGTFAPGASADLVRRLREWGASGVGQSSWGPAVYGIVEGDEAGRAARRSCASRPWARQARCSRAIPLRRRTRMACAQFTQPA